MTVHVFPQRISKIEQDFREFHAANPRVYDELVSLARDLKARGYEKFGIKMLWEVVRWRSMTRAQDRHGFKMNNSYTAYYARLIDAQEPDLRGIFQTRKQGVESHVA